MKRPDISCYQKTKYPKIYSRTYWGSSSYENCGDNIIENRNKFIEEYKIINICKTQRCDKFRRVFSKYVDLDHVEYYTVNGDSNIILVLNSPYCVNDEEHAKLVEHGFKKIYPLYHNSAQSYVKIILK